MELYMELTTVSYYSELALVLTLSLSVSHVLAEIME